MVPSNRVAQFMQLRVSIHPGISRCLDNGLDDSRRGPKHVFVGPDPRIEHAALSALLRLGPHKRDRGGQAANQVGHSIARHSFSSWCEPITTDHPHLLTLDRLKL